MSEQAEALAATNIVSAGEPTQEKGGGIKTLLQNRNFRFLWIAQVVSDFGDSLTNIALLFLINSLTGSAAAVATMFIVLTIPQITFGLVAGVYVDRLDRKRIMILSDLARGFMVLGFIAVGSRDLIWLLYVVAFVQASVGTFFNPARGALLPNIVPESSLLAANSLSQTSRIIVGVLGTAVSGALIGVFGIFWPAFTVDAVTFFVSMLLVSRIRAASHNASAATAARGNVRAIFTQLAEGLKVIGRTPALKGTLVAAAVAMLGIGAVNVLIIPLIVNDLHVSATWFGAIEFVQTSAMILSGSLVVVLARRFKPSGIVSMSMVIIGVATLGLALVSSVWHLFPVLFIVGFIMTPMQASIATLVQTSTDDKLRGRVGASLNTVVSTTNLVSMALAGVLASMLGVREVFVIGGLVTVLAGFASAVVFRSSRAADLRQSETPGTAAPLPVNLAEQ